MNKPIVGVVIALMLFAVCAQAAESKLLLGFESQSDLQSFEVDGGPGVLADEHVTQGAHSARFRGDQYLRFPQLPSDWSGYDALEIDVFVDSPQPTSLFVLIGDQAWQANSSYWNRYNASLALRPGANTVSIPLGGLYRGEVGSRYNDLKTDIDVAHIIRLDLGFEPTSQGQPGSIYLDNLRLTKWSRPTTVRAFDFGPPGQAVAPGFTPVSPDAVYSEETGWGWDPKVKPGRAWDVTFPTRLLQDSIDIGDATFRVRLRPGSYRVLVFFESLGYWDGEAAQFTQRTASGRHWRALQEHDTWGKLDFVYHFQDTEPLPGADLWGVYLSYLFQPAQADVSLPDGLFDLKVTADGPNAKRVAALIIYPLDNARAAQWVSEALAGEQQEFRSRAVELPQPQTENPAPVTDSDRSRGCLVFVPDIEQEVYLSTQPTAGQVKLDLDSFVARGQLASLTFAVRPLRDLGETKIELSDLIGDNAVIPSERLTVSVVRHLPTRSFNGLMYRIAPRYLVTATETKLPPNLTRQFWLTLRVPKEAAAGDYRGSVTLKPKHEEPITLHLRLKILPFELDEADFTTGFFGIEPNLPPEVQTRDALQRDIFRLLRERGITSFSGGPAIEFSGLDADGQPKLDFTAADKFVSAAKKAGFSREFNNYGGFIVTNLYDQGYVKGETGAALEKQYGLPYEEIVRRVWAAVQAHAERQAWLPFTYHLCDETRVLGIAEQQLDLMKLFKRVSPWLRTTGSYSVSVTSEDPLEVALQGFLGALDESMLNDHDEAVMAKARQLGKRISIYNQGQGRYSFGLYQWSERAKGVVGRYQWIAFIRHGYEYLDLDGREPDTGVMFYASEGLRSTPSLERDGEGMNDLRYLQTLENLASKAEEMEFEEAKQAAASAREFLAKVAAAVALNQRQKPDGVDLDAVRRETSDRILSLRQTIGETTKRAAPPQAPPPVPAAPPKLPPFPG